MCQNSYGKNHIAVLLDNLIYHYIVSAGLFICSFLLLAILFPQEALTKILEGWVFLNLPQLLLFYGEWTQLLALWRKGKVALMDSNWYTFDI